MRFITESKHNETRVFGVIMVSESALRVAGADGVVMLCNFHENDLGRFPWCRCRASCTPFRHGIKQLPIRSWQTNLNLN